MATCLAEKPAESTFIPNTDAPPQEYHWTVDAMYRAVDAGVFPEPSRIELIHGRIMDRMGQGPLHSILATLIAERLRAVLSPRLLVREEKSVRIAFDGEPIADIMVVNSAILNALEYYATHQVAPEDIHLIIEVAVTSADYDLGEKALLYAQAGINDYWVVLPERGQIVVHREPSAEGYSAVKRLGEDEAVSSLAAPEAVFQVRELLGR